MKVYDADKADIFFRFTRDERDSLTVPGADAYRPALALVLAHPVMLRRIPRESAIKALAVTGGWSREELADMSSDEYFTKLLWIAACDARENRSLEGHLSTY